LTDTFLSPDGSGEREKGGRIGVEVQLVGLRGRVQSMVHS